MSALVTDVIRVAAGLAILIGTLLHRRDDERW